MHPCSLFPRLFFPLLLACTLLACKRPAASNAGETLPPETEQSSPSIAPEQPAEPLPLPKAPPPSPARAEEIDSPVAALFAACNGARIDLAGPVNEIARNISADSVWYDASNPKNFADCSGIFHRLLDSMRMRCPETSLPGKSARSSRELALWYHRQGRLHLAADPLAFTTHIRPGAVMFYGGRGAGASKGLRVNAVARSINHVGVVTRVVRNAAGKVISYDLFHGQWVGKMASITDWHMREPSREEYPPFGNGTEPWVAVATLLPDS